MTQAIVSRTLYICYFGINEPLVQTQVLPYLRQLVAAGIDVSLLTFEPHLHKAWTPEKLTRQRQQLAGQGIHWFTLPYHRRPSIPATAYDILAGALFIVRLVRREKISILHARAHMPLAMALLAQIFVRVRLLFDIRGLMAEEYADAGVWPHGSIRFQLVKKLEAAGIRRADQVVVLTERLRDWLLARHLKGADQIEVIPCCVDFARFDGCGASADEVNSKSVNGNRFEVVYAGSLVGLYLVDEMGRFFKTVKQQRSNAFLRIFSMSPPQPAIAALKRAGLSEGDFEIRAVSPEELPASLVTARLGLSFRKSAFAQIAASPTKIPEYLAAGVPVLCNAGIGDMDVLLERERVGVVLRQFDDEAYRAAATEALLLTDTDEIRARCRRVARHNFDLQTVGGKGYVNAYRRLLKPSSMEDN